MIIVLLKELWTRCKSVQLPEKPVEVRVMSLRVISDPRMQ